MSSDELESAFAELSVDYWKLLRAFARATAQLDDERARRANAQERYATGRLEAALSAANIQMAVFTGRPLGADLPVSVVNGDEAGTLSDAIVEETLEPTILSGERVLRMGKVIAGAGNVPRN